MTTAALTNRAVSVFVLEHGQDFIARPAQVSVCGGGTIRFVNVTDSSITVFLPPDFKTAPVTIAGRASGQVQAPSATAPTAFGYDVFEVRPLEPLTWVLIAVFTSSVLLYAEVARRIRLATR